MATDHLRIGTLFAATCFFLCTGAAGEGEVVATNAKGLAACPCVEYVSGLDRHLKNGKLQYSPAGTSTVYEYPATYGAIDCKAHDQNLAPYCDRANAPAWCGQPWCWVDKANCQGLQYYDSSYWPSSGAYYSYVTCGSANSFTTWYELGAEGNSGVRALNILEGYLWSSRSMLEEAYIELAKKAPSADCEYSSMCPCYECFENKAWASKINVGDVGGWVNPDASQEQQRITTCLHSGISQGYSKVAAKESDAGKRIGYLYYGDQPTGSTAWWPNIDWCPKDYDPRLRPWYAAGSTGPKDVVIVVDVSGSMSKENRYVLAKDAVHTLLETLEWKDYASIVLFNQGISAEFSAKMVPVDGCMRKAMKTWVDKQNFAEGGTDFRVAMERAFKIIEDSVSAGDTSMCQKAILFLTDGKADFGDSDYQKMQQLSKRFDTTIFSYTLGSGADKSVAKKLACDNGGVFYPVPDGGDLSHIMAQYYSFFSSGQEVCVPAFTRYEDVVTGSELWPACLPIYDRSSSQAELLGVTCMDLNVMADPKEMRKESTWSDFACRVSDMTKMCRATTLTDCHKEKIRKKYSDESVCDAGTLQKDLTAPCPCIDPSCQDDEDWIDEKGYFCDTWIGDDCSKAQEEWEYSWEGTQDVLRKCRRSCRQCQLLDPCPHDTASLCSGHTFSSKSSSCRACRTDKVSGFDIEGQPMCCRSNPSSTCPTGEDACADTAAAASFSDKSVWGFVSASTWSILVCCLGRHLL
eukprot:TRINITY_DN6694_c0_g1_i1.p1 TRINITY_DN6694_c0_g1~~TRINITY_DN6694_c0_g1_i1.p1  ORF type:complete len:747 (-),score=132.23 TRINITY_DN6694_c0_g1_i1:68-2308(-)